MKKFTKIFMGLSLPITPILTALPLVSCGQGEVIYLTLNRGENVLTAKPYGDLRTGHDFKVVCTFEDGFNQISKTKTVVKCGENTLTIDKDYKISDRFTIEIFGNSITNEKVEIDIVADPTLNKNTIESEWRNIGQIQFVYPGDIIKPDDVEVWGYNGDDKEEEHPIEIKWSGTYKECSYQIARVNAPLPKFDEGYQFTEEVDLKSGPDVIPFNLMIDYGGGYFIDTIYAFCSKEVEELTIQQPKNPKVGESCYLEAVSKPKNSAPMVTWELISSPPEDTEPELDRYSGFIKFKAAGGYQVQAKSITTPWISSDPFTITVQ